MAIPKLDTDLKAFSDNFSEQIHAQPERYGISAPTAAAFAALQGAYAQAYRALIEARAGGVRSEAMTRRKDAARAEMLVLLRQLYTTVQASPTISEADKLTLGVHVRSRSPRPVAAPTEQPAMAVAGVVNRTVTVNLFDPTSQSKRRKAHGAAYADVYVWVGTNFPSDPSQWTYVGAATRATHAIHFPDSVAAGAQVWLCAAWRTRRGLTGPFGRPVTTHVQGGGVTSPGLLRAAA